MHFQRKTVWGTNTPPGVNSICSTYSFGNILHVEAVTFTINGQD